MVESQWHHDHNCIDILLEVATPQLYRTNAFRILGLSVSIDNTEIRRQQNRMQMSEKLGGAAAHNHQGALPLIPPPDSEVLRNASQRLQDMQSRIVDELFWFWPTNSVAGKEGYALLRKGDNSGAQRVWSSVPPDHPDWVAVNHNLAIMHHALALDLELNQKTGTRIDADIANSTTGYKCGTPDGKQFSLSIPNKEILGNILKEHWQAALNFWTIGIKDECMWSYLTTRAEALDDPRLTSGFVRRMRYTLPEVILSISINLVMGALKRGNANGAECHLRYLRESGFDPELVARLLERQVSPLMEQVRRICEPATDNSKASPKTANQLAQSILKESQTLLMGIRAILETEHPIRQKAFDLVASTIRICMIDYGNATEDWGGCIPILKQAASLALDKSLQSQLHDDITQAEENKKSKENECSVNLLNKAVETAKAGRPDEGRQLLGQALAVCKDPELRQTISELIENVDKSRQEAVRQRNTGYLTALFSRVVGWIIVIVVLWLIGSLVDSCDTKPSRSYTPSRSTAPIRTYSPSRQPTPFANSTGLSTRIDAGKERARTMEVEIGQMDSQLKSLSSSINQYKHEIDGYESQARMGLNTNESAYEQALENHNRIVNQYNSLTVRRNAKYSQYDQEIKSVNDMVARYNRGER